MKISVKAFCKGAFLAPIIVPLMLFPLKPNNVFAILLLSFWIAGIPYILFTILCIVRIGRIKEDKQVMPFMWVAPLMFLPFALVGWLLQLLIGRMSNPELIINMADLLPIAVFTLLLGYIYVLIGQLILFILRRVGVVG